MAILKCKMCGGTLELKDNIMKQEDYSKHNKRKKAEKAQIGLFLLFEIDFIVADK